MTTTQDMTLEQRKATAETYLRRAYLALGILYMTEMGSGTVWAKGDKVRAYFTVSYQRHAYNTGHGGWHHKDVYIAFDGNGRPTGKRGEQWLASIERAERMWVEKREAEAAEHFGNDFSFIEDEELRASVYAHIASEREAVEQTWMVVDAARQHFIATGEYPEQFHDTGAFGQHIIPNRARQLSEKADAALAKKPYEVRRGMTGSTLTLEHLTDVEVAELKKHRHVSVHAADGHPDHPATRMRAEKAAT